MAKQEKQKVTTKDVKAEIAKEAKRQGKDIEISATDVVNVRFKEDFGKMKKDKVYRISAFAYQVYDKNGVVEKIN